MLQFTDWVGLYDICYRINVGKPIVFTSHTLLTSGSNYSQIDKEAFALVYTFQKFHAYLYDRKFTMVTVHKTLTSN